MGVQDSGRAAEAGSRGRWEGEFHHKPKQKSRSKGVVLLDVMGEIAIEET